MSVCKCFNIACPLPTKKIYIQPALCPLWAGGTQLLSQGKRTGSRLCTPPAVDSSRPLPRLFVMPVGSQTISEASRCLRTSRPAAGPQICFVCGREGRVGGRVSRR